MNDKKIIFFLLSIISFILLAGTFFSYASVNNDTTFTISQCTTSWTILKAESRYMWVLTNSWAQPKHYACDTNDILVCTWYQTGIILSACNVWASVAGTGKISNGMYFQYGRNKGFYYQSWATFEDVLLDVNIGWNAGNDKFWFIGSWYNDGLTNRLSWYNWKVNTNWWNIHSEVYQRQWPCSQGYHLPTFEEMNTILKMNPYIFKYFPKGWVILRWPLWNNSIDHITRLSGVYWIITQEFSLGLSQFGMSINENNQLEMINYDPWKGLSVRCFKNLWEEKISYTTEKIKVPFSEFKQAFQEYFEVDKNNYFKKFWKTFQLVPIIEQPILLEDNIWMFQDYQERLKNDVIYKKAGKYFYSNGWYYFVRIK